MRGFIVFSIMPGADLRDQAAWLAQPCLGSDEMQALEQFHAANPTRQVIGMISLEEMRDHARTVVEFAARHQVDLRLSSG